MIVTSKKDLETILKIQKEAFYEEAVKHDDLSMAPMTQTLEQIEKEFDEGTLFFTLEEKGEIIASVRAKLEEKVCKIGRLVVSPEHQKKGIGIIIMQELEDFFKDKCEVFSLFTGEKSKNALSLYTKLGYKIINFQNVGSYSLINMEKTNLKE